jgi:hypothetical protein
VVRPPLLVLLQMMMRGVLGLLQVLVLVLVVARVRM